MTTVRVKICGITREADALAAAECGADALGFNFWTDSKRHCTPEMAARIARKLPPFLNLVGVFVNATEEEVRKVITEVPRLSALQFHGNETPEYCARFDLPVIKAVRVADRGSLPVLQLYQTSAILLDTPTPGFGGSGKAFDWRLLQGLRPAVPIILAGGLTAENVAEAVRIVRPYAVDVASGVEKHPGEKDVEKMRLFVRTVKEVESGSNA